MANVNTTVTGTDRELIRFNNPDSELPGGFGAIQQSIPPSNQVEGTATDTGATILKDSVSKSAGVQVSYAQSNVIWKNPA